MAGPSQVGMCDGAEPPIMFYFIPKNPRSGLTRAHCFWEREGRVIWRSKKHKDKRVYNLLGCSSLGVVDSRGDFIWMAKAVGPRRGQVGHQDGNPWKPKGGKCAGNAV